MLVMCSEPCFQQVLQSLQYLGREQEAPASPWGLDPQHAFLEGLENALHSSGKFEIREGGSQKTAPLPPRKVKESDRNSLCNGKLD